MCRSDIAPAARGLLGRILGDMAAALADQAGVPAGQVVIGPVDFGESDEPASDRPDDWCTCGHARDEHGETGTCLGNHRIENPDFSPGEAFIDNAECYCGRFEFWYASEATDG